MDPFQVLAGGMVGAVVGLISGYAGARFQAQREMDAELREILREATKGMQALGKAVNEAWAQFMQEGPNALTDLTRNATQDLAAELYHTEAHNDLISINVERDAPVYRHYVAAVRAGQALHDALAYALNLPPDLRGTYDAPKVFREAKAATEDFTAARYRYYDAVQALNAPRFRRGRIG